MAYIVRLRCTHRKLTHILAAFITCTLTTALSHAQESKPTVKEPKTQLEAFEAQTGAVLIKGIGDIGNVAGLRSLGGGVREFADAGSGRKQYGVAIEVKEIGRFERKDTAFIN